MKSVFDVVINNLSSLWMPTHLHFLFSDDATRKDHFPLRFMDQTLDNEFSTPNLYKTNLVNKVKINIFILKEETTLEKRQAS